MRRQNHTFPLLTLALMALVLHATTAHAAERTRRSTSSRPIPNPKFDPTAEKVEYFEATKEGQIKTKVIAMGAEHGKLLITNTTDAPLSVQAPQSFVLVKVLKQFGQQGGGGGFGGGGGLGGGGGQQGGGQQNAGGGGLGGGQQGGGGFGGGGQQGGGGGFFSIPPEKTVSLKYVSVCLNHGLADPTPTANYKVVPVDEYTKDPILQELITMVSTRKLAPQAAQAAVWNRTDNMSWQQLAAKFKYNAIGNKVPYFHSNDVRGAQMISAAAIGRVREREKEQPVVKTTPAEPVVPSRVR